VGRDFSVTRALLADERLDAGEQLLLVFRLGQDAHAIQPRHAPCVPFELGAEARVVFGRAEALLNPGTLGFSALLAPFACPLHPVYGRILVACTRSGAPGVLLTSRPGPSGSLPSMPLLFTPGFRVPLPIALLGCALLVTSVAPALATFAGRTGVLPDSTLLGRFLGT
jgi:hypothetical protein